MTGGAKREAESLNDSSKNHDDDALKKKKKVEENIIVVTTMSNTMKIRSMRIYTLDNWPCTDANPFEN